tara:strand:- start:766 stop:3690 length:2925 start_codon:yes stop_codon:yes gene_type:complete
MGTGGSDSFAGAFSVAQNAVTNLDNNYIGLASSTASDGQNVDINLTNSINTSQSGLTIGDDYFSNGAGEINKFISTSTSGAVTEVYSSETALNDPSEKVTVVSDGNNTFLMVYQGTSLYTTIQAGTMSGTTMTWGTAQVFESTDTSGWSAWWDSYRSCFVVVARGATSNNHIRGKTITVSGQAITIVNSSETTVFGNSYAQSSMVGGYDSTAQVGFVVNSRGNSPTKTSVIVVSVDSSKNISWGSEVTSNDRIYYASQFVHDSSGNGNVSVIGATYNSSTTAEVNSTQAYVITISGTTPTIKTPVVLNASAYKHGYSVYDASANKTICIYDDATKVYYNVCSMSSGTLTAGTHTEIATGSISSDTQDYAYCGCYDPFTQQIGIVYGDSSNYYYLRSGKVSGTSITWSDAQAVDPSTVNKDINLVNANSTDSNVLVLYWVNSDSAFNTWTMGSAGTTTYVQTDAQYIGEAISATSLLLKNTPTDIVFGKADSDISKGRSVVVEADGDFKQVSGAVSTGSEATTSYMEVHSTCGDVFGIASDGAGTMCVVFRGTSNYIQVSKGTLAADHSIAWATPVTMSTVYGNSCSVYYDKTNEFFVANFQSYSDWYSYRVTGSGNTTTVTNTHSTSYGTSTGVTQQAAAYSESESCGIVYLGKQTGKIGTLTSSQAAASGSGYRSVSGLVGSTGSDSQFLGMDYDQTTDVGVAWWRAEANSDYPTVRAFTVSGSGNGSVTLGTAVVLESTGTNAYGGVALNGTEGLAVWKSSSTELRQNSFTLSGTTITKGTAGAVARDGSEEYYVEGTQLLTYNPMSDRYYFAYNNSADNYDVMLKELQNSSGTVSVTNTIKVFDASNNQNYYWNVKYVGNTTAGRENQQAYMLMLGKEHGDDAGTFGYAPAYTSSTSNLTTENFIGFAEANATANGTSKVRIHGINPNLTGLTPGQTLYVTANGDLSETAETGTVVEAGKAISATQLLVRG